MGSEKKTRVVKEHRKKNNDRDITHDELSKVRIQLGNISLQKTRVQKMWIPDVFLLTLIQLDQKCAYDMNLIFSHHVS